MRLLRRIALPLLLPRFLENKGGKDLHLLSLREAAGVYHPRQEEATKQEASLRLSEAAAVPP